MASTDIVLKLCSDISLGRNSFSLLFLKLLPMCLCISTQADTKTSVVNCQYQQYLSLIAHEMV